MVIARSKMTAQGQISIPAEVRRKLNLAPGSTLEWDQKGKDIVIRRTGKYTWEDIRRALFLKPPRPKKLEELKEGIRTYIRRRHARH